MNHKLSVPDFMKLFTYHGCDVTINRKNKVRMRIGDRRFSQHAHSGEQDAFDAEIVGRARRKMGFADMPDDVFYAPVRKSKGKP